MGRRRVTPGVGGIEPIDIGQQHQKIGRHHLGHPRGQPVIIAIANFFCGDRVIFIDHRHGAQIEQGRKGGPRIQPAPPHLCVIAGQEDLRHTETLGFERLFPGPHQKALPGRGGGLLLIKIEPLALQAKPALSQSHRSRRHHHHSLATSAQSGDVLS